MLEVIFHFLHKHGFLINTTVTKGKISPVVYIFLALIGTLLITLYLFTDAKKDKEHGQSTVWILTLVVIILVAMGFMAYFLFKIKNQSETQRAVRQYSTLLEHSSNLPGGDVDNDPASNKEKDEHSII